MPMDRRSFMMAAMSACEAEPFSPVQVQKLFFILDRKIADQTNDGPYFQFEPYAYGPFDAQVYRELEDMEEDGLILIENSDMLTPRSYRLTVKGYNLGRSMFDSMAEHHRHYIVKLVTFIHEVSFATLVSAVYKAYPEMKVNSIFVS